MICHELARLEISSEASATLRASMHRFYKHAASLHKPTFVEQAIYVSTLMRLGTSPETLGGILEKLIVDISTAKDEDLTCPVYTERIQSGVPITVGSAQLTCAYVAEACDTYLTLTDAADKKHTEREINYHTQIINNISLIITPFTDSKHVFEHILRQPKDGDSTKAITLLGYRWDYKNKKETSINDTFDIQIGLITILGWISYTIFDHVIDNEKDMAKHIPLAEHCNRLLHKHLNTLTTTPEQTVMISKLLNLIESAHYTECQSFVPPCWHKSAGHMIGPLLIIMKQGYGPASPRYKATKKFFITFLSAKQISDDLHDWENDWVNGRHTEVTEHIRRCAHTPTTLTQLRKIFAEKTLSFFSQQIIDHCTVALKALTHTGPHRNTEYFKKAVVKLQNSARRAILEVDVITLLKKDPVKN